MKHSFPLYNITIFDFCKIFNDIVVQQYNSLCLEYNITKFDVTAKRLLTHCMIKTCCDHLMQVESGKVCFFYSRSCIEENILLPQDIKDFLHKCITECSRKLPISLYCSSKPLQYYIELIENHQGISFLLQLSNKSKAKYSFDKAHKFITKNQLTFLNENYFSCLRTRCCLLNS